MSRRHLWGHLYGREAGGRYWGTGIVRGTIRSTEVAPIISQLAADCVQSMIELWPTADRSATVNSANTRDARTRYMRRPGERLDGEVGWRGCITCIRYRDGVGGWERGRGGGGDERRGVSGLARVNISRRETSRQQYRGSRKLRSATEILRGRTRPWRIYRMSVFQLRTGAALKISRRPADITISPFPSSSSYSFFSFRWEGIFVARYSCRVSAVR